MRDCVFCQPAAAHLRTNVDSALFEARWDGHPLTEGHALVIPKWHIVSLFELDRFEIGEAFTVLRSIRRVIGNEYGVEDFNIGVNDGTAAGRTVNHLHIHVIPRRLGDVEDPRGGIRNMLPGSSPDLWAPREVRDVG